MAFSLGPVRLEEFVPSVVQDRSLDQWWTEPALARWFVHEGLRALERVLHGQAEAEALLRAWLPDSGLSVPGPRVGVLEPAAGYGALVRAVGQEVPGVRLLAVEVDERLRPELDLRAQACAESIVLAEDFLSRSARDSVARWAAGNGLTICFGNPPYSKPRKTVSLEFALAALAYSDALFFLVHAGFLHGLGRYEQFWSQYGRHCFWLRHIVDRPQFGVEHEDGGGLATPKTDYVAFGILKARPVPVDLDWVSTREIAEKYG